jgi:hypothetical protein
LRFAFFVAHFHFFFLYTPFWMVHSDLEKITSKVYFDVEIEGSKEGGRIVMGLVRAPLSFVRRLTEIMAAQCGATQLSFQRQLT